MTPQRWSRIQDIFQEALQKPAAERAAFLDDVCRGDEPLRRNVELLLAGEAEKTLTSPTPSFLKTGKLELSPGETLAHYRVEAKIGQGGMGAVYRGYDPRLQRKVALKVLPAEHSADRELRSRLMREARAASALNHPNIVTIYEVGSDRDVDFIAMECVEGQPLDQLIPRAGLPTTQVLRYSVQIANGLAKAHAAGILHRDLKPSNIMVTTEDRVKILDFGLAKVAERPDGQREALTASGDLTEEGAVMGTPAYMSPEQAEGRKLDARSDVFSFGSVLYEMVTGRKSFAGESRLAVLNRIVNGDPEPPGQVVPLMPDFEKLILRCLRKDPARRYQSMADLNVALEDLEIEISGSQKQSPDSASAKPRRPVTIRRLAVIPVLIAAAAGIAWIGAHFFHSLSEPAPGRTVKFTFTPNHLKRGGDNEIDAEVSISPDGKHVDYVEEDGQLWVRDLDQEKAHVVPGATQVYQVFWSPDSQQLGYANSYQDLMRTPALGGTPTLITKIGGRFRRASWNTGGEIVYGVGGKGLFTVPALGGTPTLVVAHPHIEHPSFLELPDGRRAFLFQSVANPPKHAIYIQVAGESQRRLITETESSNPYPAYSPTGHIVYADGAMDSSGIWALPFSLRALQATGKAFPIAEHGSSPSVSRNGTLVYSDVPANRVQMAWCDRSGKLISNIGNPQYVLWALLSPDGHRLAVEITESDPDIWIYDLDRDVKTRFTSDSALEATGVWSPSGDEFVYATNRAGNFDIVSKPSGGNGDARVLVGTALMEQAPEWSPGQKFLVYDSVSPDTKGDLLYRERRGDGSLGEPLVFLRTPSEEGGACFSPDGRFVAYTSSESGKNEVYVRDFPGASKKWQVSPDGGSYPRWRRDGKELFYNQGRRLLAVPVLTQPTFSPGTPVQLFTKKTLQTQFDVSPDGQRFLIRVRPDEQPLSIHVVHNWFEEFRGREPAR